jgi:hypothetical protein
MKKKALLIGVLVLLIGVSPARAQKFYGGFIDGLNFAELKVKNDEGLYKPTSP